MRNRILVSTVLAVILFPAAVGHAQFLKPAQIDFKSILAAPPAQDSQQTKDEIAKILALQQTRTPQEVKRAQSEVKINPFIYSGVLGSGFNPDDLPVTAALLKQVTQETAAIYNPAKEYYGRKRPFLVDSRVIPCVTLEKSASYPSGHSTSATVWALILAEIYPDQRDALLARSRQIGDDRVLAGVHFPSDVQAGRVLAAAIAKQMLADPDFQAQLERACDEVRLHRKSG